MRKACRVMVTGAGSGVGQGIIKALRIANLPTTIVGADIGPVNAGLYRSDEAVLIPRVEDDGALVKILELLSGNHIDVVMVGSEFDLAFFSQHREEIREKTGAIVVAAPPSTVAIADDKWSTAEFLRKAGLPYAEAYLPIDLEDASSHATMWGYPLVLKSRSGTSSRHVHIIRDNAALCEYYPRTPNPMLQKMIALPSDELGCEYTCSIFKTSSGDLIGPFTARRTVRGGTSWHIEVAPFEALHKTLLDIARVVPFAGSLNVQLMLTDSGPVPFELNARFSGTTAVRAHFGFNEPEMSIRDLFYGEVIEPPVVRSGIVMRYVEEVFIEGLSLDNLRPGERSGLVNPWF